MAECGRLGATLLITNLDQLSRDAAYVLLLDVPFVAVDIPELNTLTKGISASIAQHERELIGKWIIEALAANKARGESLGTTANLAAEGRQQGQAIQQQNAR
ncbi:recombinase family protein [Hymenobacter sp. YC55]|uniref:recombinase family protein n=1 Tax=Hymenobacter sp. YC55 TaxID=3034019 RepID=UPI0023F7C3FE|nr:recombinase family protein [Hymenobacter sp. YC55]MDF7815160.1 recombinase family protein [Hymenobacter sp. YC55]